jgi:hypothetical protein
MKNRLLPLFFVLGMYAAHSQVGIGTKNPSLSGIILLFLLVFKLSNENDLIESIISSLVLIIFFLMLQYSFVDSICKIIFRLAKRLLKSENFTNRYRLNFTNSLICVHSPFGGFSHKWCKIEKAILTKDFFFLYVKEKNGYIISISNKCANKRNIGELVSFIEKNITEVTKV